MAQGLPDPPPAAALAAAQSAGSAPGPGSAPAGAVPRRTALFGLWTLTLINLFNYIDRYVISAVLEGEGGIKQRFSLSDGQAGALAIGFVVVYAVTSPFFGTLGDRHRRLGLIAFGVAVWSVATALGAFARGFLSLFLARAVVGIGEAAYGSIAPSLLSDYFPKERRGRVFAVFYAAIPIGSALGFAIGGAVGARWGWRAAFLVAGLPGLLLALLVLLLTEPRRGINDPDSAHYHHPNEPSRDVVASYRTLARNPAYVLTVLGLTSYTFALGGLAWWMPTFMERVHHVPKADAGFKFGALLCAAGFLGTALGGWLGDRLLSVTKQSYLWLSAISTLAAVPFAIVGLTSSTPGVYWTAIFLAEVLVFISTGPINTTIVNVVPVELRSTAMAASIFTIHVLGDAISPAIIGFVSDVADLRTALVVLIPLSIAIGAALWFVTALRGEK